MNTSRNNANEYQYAVQIYNVDIIDQQQLAPGVPTRSWNGNFNVGESVQHICLLLSLLDKELQFYFWRKCSEHCLLPSLLGGRPSEKKKTEHSSPLPLHRYHVSIIRVHVVYCTLKNVGQISKATSLPAAYCCHIICHIQHIQVNMITTM